MSEKTKSRDKIRVEKSKKKKEKAVKSKKEKAQQATSTVFSLLANDQSLDPTLSSLFAVKQPPVKSIRTRPLRAVHSSATDDDLSSVDEDIEDESDVPVDGQPTTANKTLTDHDLEHSFQAGPKRKRKRGDVEDELESAYMQKLAREDAKEADRAAVERRSKRSKPESKTEGEDTRDEESDEDDIEGEDGESAPGSSASEDELEQDGNAPTSPPPRHETEANTDVELSKANRTVFLGNVSTGAISSKSGRKALLQHLASFFDKVAAPREGEPKHQVESIRFRSTPYASAIPKKAAFAKKELMDATTKSTNAYAVYSSPMLAREATKRLNGSTVLDRHLRVDQVAHPAQVDHRRCVFVGNLGFVDDESNMMKANAEEGRETRKPGKEPADIEEGLWRTFSKCGTVESVRVIRDSTTRVGKGVAYVQFENENGVEAALLYNDKKFPPMLPRKLRVTRARAQKRNAKPGSGRPTTRPAANGYQRKVTAAEASQAGRAGKLLGRAGAARTRNPNPIQGRDSGSATKDAGNLQKPEAFIFEGHRASARQGKTGLKLGGRGKKAKVTKRSASFRTSQRKG